jgi:hypothetical protein
MCHQKKSRIILLLFALLLMFSLSSAGYCSDAPPLPSDMHIVPPGPNVPIDLARLSGKWVGTVKGQGQGKYTYGYSAQHVLIVEKIDEVGIITVIYARGDVVPALKSYAPAFWARYKASWSAATKELMVSYPYENQQATISYKLAADGKMIASGQIGNEVREYTLHKE